jgi:hypothetical protein
MAIGQLGGEMLEGDGSLRHSIRWGCLGSGGRLLGCGSSFLRWRHEYLLGPTGDASICSFDVDSSKVANLIADRAIMVGRAIAHLRTDGGHRI